MEPLTMNKAVAEHLMGWTDVHVQMDAMYRIPAVFGRPADARPNDAFLLVVPDYQGDIAAAWLVVERTGAKVRIGSVEGPDGPWWAEFETVSGRFGRQTAPAAAQAICVAALAAIGCAP